MTTSDHAAPVDEVATPARTSDALTRVAEAVVTCAPAWLLALLAAGVPLVMWSAVEDQVVIPRLAATALLTGVACLALATSATPAFALRPVRVPLLLLAVLIAWWAICTAAGVDIGNSLMGESRRYQGLLPLMMYAALLVAAMLATARLQSARVLLAGVFVGGVAAGGYALLQRLGLDWVDWYGLPAGRVGASFAQPNVLGVELVTAGLASVALWTGATRQQRAVIVAGCSVMLIALVFTYSRGAWVGLVAGVAAFGFLHLLTDDESQTSLRHARRRAPNKRIAASIALPAVAVIFFVAGTVAVVPSARHVSDRATSIIDLRENSVSAHVGLWRTSLEMIRDRPLAGAGPESFSTLFAAYRTPDQPEYRTANVRPESSHNFFLDQAVGTGLPGLALIVALIGGVLAVALRGARRDAQRRPYIVGMSAALVAYYGAVFFSFSEAMTAWLPWLLMGALLGLCIAPREAAPTSAGGARSNEFLGSALALSLRFGGAALGVALLAAAYVVIAADWNAGRAHDAAAAGNLGAAATDARRASKLNPLDRQYLYDVGSYEEAAAASDPAALDRALAAYRKVDDRFAPTAYGRLSEARVIARTYAAGRAGVDLSEVTRLLEEGARLDPYNVDARREIASIFRAIGEPARATEFDTP